ncbi:MAG: LysM peptidoglycan-binding domain-containing protein [Actinomycetota bacterium]|nr:LysM peptidoglycan-binding domain-containing protein [Actinomycetota bacterium]
MVAVVQSRPSLAQCPRPAPSPATRRRRAAPSELTYRRRRTAAAGIVVALVMAVQGLLAVVGGAGAPERSAAPVAPDRFSTYVVQPGDTLWTIARGIDPDGDPRPLVDRLVAERGTAVLHVGERIALPERR